MDNQRNIVHLFQKIILVNNEAYRYFIYFKVICPCKLFYVPNYYEIGTENLASFERKIWDSLPANIKSAETFKVFKKLIKTWDGQMRKCRMCTYNKNRLNCVKINNPRTEVNMTIKHIYFDSANIFRS